jgi:cytochrome P450
LVASDDPTLGSVIPKNDLISPLRRGFNHDSFYFAEPNKCKVSMFPVSGALQLKISDAIIDLPIISHS